MANLAVGDIVVVHVPKVGTFDFSEIEKYNETEQKISKIVRVVGNNTAGSYIEFEGASSDMGVPYSFLGEWVQKV